MRQNQAELTIRFAADSDTPAVIALWELCFPGDSGFQKYYFENLYHPGNNLLLFKGNTLCAMAQMLPYSMQNGCVTETVTYIYGACTHPDFRRQHLMDALLHRSFALDREMGRAASVLIPQEEWLFGFYAQFGYVPALHASYQRYAVNQAVRPCALRPASEDDLSEMDALFHARLWEGTYLCRDQGEWRKQLRMFQGCGGEVLCAEQDGALVGYAFVWHADGRIWAQELVAAAGMEERFAAALMARYGRESCDVTGLQFSHQQPLGCVMRHDGAQPADGYINLMLN